MTMMAGLNKVEKIIRVAYGFSGQLERTDVQIACAILNNSGVVALPTDTLYGIAARVDNSEALDRIYKIKGRDHNKPLAVCVATTDEIEQVADLGGLKQNVINSLLPGPLTLILKRSSNLNKDLNPNLSSIGVRIPDHNFIRAVAAELCCPLALTSANRSGETSPTDIDEFKDIWDDLDAIFNVGPIKPALTNISSRKMNMIRNGSTVIDLTQERAFKIIREGCGYDRAHNVLNRLGFRKLK